MLFGKVYIQMWLLQLQAARIRLFILDMDIADMSDKYIFTFDLE